MVREGEGEEGRLCDELASAALVADLGAGEAEELVRAVTARLGEAGFSAERRAEGWAFFPAGLRPDTHIRLGRFGGTVSVWIRDPYGLESSGRNVGLTARDLYEILVRGLRAAAEAFGEIAGRGAVVRIPGSSPD